MYVGVLLRIKEHQEPLRKKVHYVRVCSLWPIMTSEGVFLKICLLVQDLLIIRSWSTDLKKAMKGRETSKEWIKFKVSTMMTVGIYTTHTPRWSVTIWHDAMFWRMSSYSITSVSIIWLGKSCREGSITSEIYCWINTFFLIKLQYNNFFGVLWFSENSIEVMSVAMIQHLKVSAIYQQR